MNKILFIIAGIACIVIGVFSLTTYFSNKKTQTAETVATVIRVDSELEQDTDGYDTRYYYPVIEYEVEGQTYEERLPDSGTTNSTSYKEGDEIAISYNPDKPDEISKKGSKGGLLAGIFFIVVGLIVTVASFLGKIR